MAIIYGYGYVEAIALASGLSTATIYRGMKEINQNDIEMTRIRRVGAGRRPKTEDDETLVPDLKALLEGTTRGDPESLQKWTTWSCRKLAKALQTKGHSVSHTLVCKLLHQLGYSLQSNKKTKEGNQHPDRDKQFKHIAEVKNAALHDNQPIVSMDTKNKIQTGNKFNKGRTWREKNSPIEVDGHDFFVLEKQLIPFGIFDIGRNKGFFMIGTEHDTSSFAVSSVRKWWKNEGCVNYPKAEYLVITVDAGGSNGYRNKGFKLELQKFSDEIQLPIKVCHYPPGTSKWNPVEHCLFSFISMHWRGVPLTDDKTVLKLIRSTTTTTGLTVKAYMDRKKYPTGIKISEKDFAGINIVRDKFLGEFNYTIFPKKY